MSLLSVAVVTLTNPVDEAASRDLLAVVAFKVNWPKYFTSGSRYVGTESGTASYKSQDYIQAYDLYNSALVAIALSVGVERLWCVHLW